MNETENSIKEHLLTWRTLVLFVIIFTPLFFSNDIYSPFLVLMGLFLIFLNYDRIKISYLKVVLPLLIVFVLGTIGLAGHESRNTFRDVSYALTPISLIFIGFWMADNNLLWPKILKVFITAGIIIAGVHLSKLLVNPEIISDGLYNIRKKAMNPNVELVVLSLVLGIFQNRLHIENLFPKFFPRKIAVPLLFVSFAFSLSRIGLIIGIVLTISILGFIGKINWRTILTISILIGSFFLIVLITPTDESGTFLSKIARIGNEVTVSDYEDRSDINSHWRGFETYLAGIAFTSGNTRQIIMGQGFGALIDLGFTMTLAGVDFSEIPILHNGYAYILVKTGILGLLCYVFFYFNLLKCYQKFNTSINPEQILLSRFLLGCSLVLVLSMFVIGGMSEIHNTEFVVLTGFVLRRMEQL